MEPIYLYRFRIEGVYKFGIVKDFNDIFVFKLVSDYISSNFPLIHANLYNDHYTAQYKKTNIDCFRQATFDETLEIYDSITKALNDKFKLYSTYERKYLNKLLELIQLIIANWEDWH